MVRVRFKVRARVRVRIRVGFRVKVRVRIYGEVGRLQRRTSRFGLGLR